MTTLKPCKYRFTSNKPNRVKCISTQLIHSGTVSTEICMICPYCTIERNDFYKMTNKLFTTKNPTYTLLPCCGQNK